MMDIERAYETGRRIGSGDDHNLYASKETLKTFSELKIELATHKQKMEDLSKQVETGFSEIKLTLKEMMIKLDDKVGREEAECTAERLASKTEEVAKELKESKADKWVEKVLSVIVSVIGIGFLGVIGTLIFQAIVHFNNK